MKRLMFLTIATVCVAGFALGQDVQYNFDPGADFSKYRTYRWEKDPQSLDVDDLTLGQLAKGFEAALAAKGLSRNDSGEPDMVIVFHIAMSEEKQLNTYSTGGYGYGPYWRGGWYGGMGTTMTTATTSTISIGSIVLDMYDTATKHLVWRGMATKTVNQQANPEKRQKNINKAATKMLKNYPPKKKG